MLPPHPPAVLRPTPDAAAYATGVKRLAGVDEAGRGPWAGPVVACAVILRRRRLPVRIDDSKRLTIRQRTRAFSVILEHAEVGVGLCCAQDIDRHNILRATLLAMQQALLDLPKPPELALIDGAQIPTMPIPCWPVIHGDQRSYVIGCASIMAKVLRDSLMRFYHELFPDHGFDQHQGYGTALHAQRLQAFGPSLLHRKTFTPVAAMIIRQSVRQMQRTHPTAADDLQPSSASPVS